MFIWGSEYFRRNLQCLLRQFFKNWLQEFTACAFCTESKFQWGKKKQLLLVMKSCASYRCASPCKLIGDSVCWKKYGFDIWYILRNMKVCLNHEIFRVSFRRKCELLCPCSVLNYCAHQIHLLEKAKWGWTILVRRAK